MANDNSAHVITFEQPTTARAQRQRKRQAKAAALNAASLARADLLPAVLLGSVPKHTATSETDAATPAPRRPLASWLLVAVAFGLAAVAIVINGWFAMSLGSSP